MRVSDIFASKEQGKQTERGLGANDGDDHRTDDEDEDDTEDGEGGGGAP